MYNTIYICMNFLSAVKMEGILFSALKDMSIPNWQCLGHVMYVKHRSK